MIVVVTFALFSCQKEIDWTLPPASGGGNPGGGNPGGGNTGTNGDLLVKAVAITGGTADTNVVTFTWDASKRLTQYKSTGKTNGFDVSGLYNIQRASDGRIEKIFAEPFALFPGMPVSIDSTIYYVNYQGTTNKLKYVMATTYMSGTTFSDSIVYTYSGTGKVDKKETYRESFVSGTMELSSRETYTYDGLGNLLTATNSTADPITGVLAPAGTTTMTFGAGKAPAVMGEECFIILSPENGSPNIVTKKVQSGNAGGGNVTGTITATATVTTTNSFGRPTKGSILVTPVPPGYTLNYTYYYQ